MSQQSTNREIQIRTGGSESYGIQWNLKKTPNAHSIANENCATTLLRAPQPTQALLTCTMYILYRSCVQIQRSVYLRVWRMTSDSPVLWTTFPIHCWNHLLYRITENFNISPEWFGWRASDLNRNFVCRNLIIVIYNVYWFFFGFVSSTRYIHQREIKCDAHTAISFEIEEGHTVNVSRVRALLRCLCQFRMSWIFN